MLTSLAENIVKQTKIYIIMFIKRLEMMKMGRQQLQHFLYKSSTEKNKILVYLTRNG